MKHKKIFLLLFGLLIAVLIIFLTGKYLFYKNQIASKDILTRTKLVGVWQKNYMMAAGWADRYHFFDSGKYLFYKSQMDCESRDISHAGFWEIKNNKLVITVHTETKLINGSLQKSSGSCGTKNMLVNVQEKIENLEVPQIIKMVLSEQCKNTPEGIMYNCIAIGDAADEFYQFSDKPSFSGFSQESDVKEPQF